MNLILVKNQDLQILLQLNQPKNVKYFEKCYRREKMKILKKIIDFIEEKCIELAGKTT